MLPFFAAEIPDIEDIVPPVEPTGGLPSAWIIVGALVVVLVLFVAFLQQRANRSEDHVEDYDPRRSALDKLHRLKENHAKVPSRECGLDVTFALREYLCAFHDQHIPYETTGELLAALEEGGMDEQAHNAISTVFHECDAMKYAAIENTTEKRLEVIESAIRFIRDDSERRKQATQETNEDPVAA